MSVIFMGLRVPCRGGRWGSKAELCMILTCVLSQQLPEKVLWQLLAVEMLTACGCVPAVVGKKVTAGCCPSCLIPSLCFLL